MTDFSTDLLKIAMSFDFMIFVYRKIFQNIGQNLNCGQKEAFLFMSQCAATKGLSHLYFE